MVSLPAPLGRPYRNVQDVPTRNELLQNNCILLDVLKTLELELQRRGMLSACEQSSGAETPAFHPVWFLAETERNIFLWRNGCSLIEHDEFEFWIDVRALIAKRLGALERFDSDNPFVNPLWGSSLSVPSGGEAEKDYLERFLAVITSISDHASALCQVGSALIKELCPGAESRPSVSLPIHRKRASEG